MPTQNVVGNGLVSQTGTGSFVGSDSPTFDTIISIPNDPGAFPASSIVIGANVNTANLRLGATGNNANQNNGSGSGYYMATGVLGTNYQTAYLWQRYSGTGNGGNLILSKGRGTSANPIVYDFSLTIGNSNGTGSLIIGASTMTSNQADIYGVTDGSAAPAGYWQEIISSSIPIGSAVSLTSATPLSITSINLTAGSWDVWGNIGFIGGSGTLITSIEGSINTVTNTQATPPNLGMYFKEDIAFPATSEQVVPIGMTRVNFSSTTTYYLVAQATFTVSTCTAYGFIGARRRY